MADRTVVYRLQADVTQFRAQMAAASASTRKAAGDLGNSMNQGATKAGTALDGLGVNAATVGLALGGAVVLASANFEQAMSNVQAATHGSAASMDLLRDAALEAGATTAFSASEAAAGIENLAKAGISTADILDGGLSGALDLAAAGGMDVASAAEAAAGAMAQFKLEGSEATHVADLLAAGAGKAQGEVSDMVMALKQSGTVAAQTGLSIEETTGALAAMAEQSLLGSDAGTSFKTMLSALTPNSKKAADAMEQYNINAFDAQGNFVGMTALAGQLEAGLGHLTVEQRSMALETIFGSDAVRAASIIYDNGAEGVANWTASVNDAGYAAETAAIKTDNLKGDVEELKGALETAFIEQGEGSSGLLRTLTQLSTEAINLNTQIGNSEGAVGAFATEAKSMAGGPLTFMGDKILNIKDAYNDVFGETEKVAEATEDMGAVQVEAANKTAILKSAMQQSAEEIEAQAKALQDARKAARETAGGFVNLTDALNDSKKSLGQWITQMANQADALNNFTTNAQKAARRGLRDGLIAALKDAGTEGALRMKQLANATDAEIDRANSAWSKGQKAIDRYVDATAKVPKNVSTNVNVEDRMALASFREIDQMMSNLDGRVATTYVRTVNQGGMGPQEDRRKEATGGYISGPGTATSDSIPALLSNGEYVIKAAAVDHYGMGTFDRMNAMRLAGGGSVKKGKKRSGAGVNEEFNDAADAARERREQEAARRQELLDQDEAFRLEAQKRRDEILATMEEDRIKKAEERDAAVLAGQEKAWDKLTGAAESLVKEVEGNMDRIGDAATSAFKSNLFGGSQQQQQHGLWVGGTGAASDGGSSWQGALGADIAGLQERQGLIAQLSAQGITGSALEALLGQGSNTDISSLLASGQAGQFAAMFAQREMLSGQVAQQAGVAGYGADMATATAQLVELTEAIKAARPITVLEAVSAEATAREMVRLLAIAGGS